MQPSFRRFSGSGFTILELIVALSVTVLMLVMISALFTATSDGVALGMAVSDVVGAGRSIADQLERDSDRMLSPTNLKPGFMVIVCQQVNGVAYRDRRFEKTRDVRTDQIMWMYDRAAPGAKVGEQPITPVDANTFSSATRTQMASSNAIRIWYGHVKKTTASGADGGNLGAPGENRLANNWALGRQALFLVDDAAAISAINRTTGALAALATADVSGMTAWSGTPTPPASLKLFHGTTDVAALRYSGDPLTQPGTLMGGFGASTDPGIYRHTLWVDEAEGKYQDRALAHMFLDGNRLWANPYPRPNPLVNTSWITSGQVGQMHSLLMDNVSDFIVDFAADAVADSNIPDDANGFDGAPDVDPTTRETIWYGLGRQPNAASWTRNKPGVASPIVPSPAGGGVGFVFRHGKANSVTWPYMIRIRFRLHDQRGELLGDVSPEPDATNVGRWFEQIIKVRRN